MVLIADVLTNSQPRITIHCLDYLSSLQKKMLINGVFYQNQNMQGILRMPCIYSI